MKRSEALLKLKQYHDSEYSMIEFNYITKDEFFNRLLQIVEDLGMKPPIHYVETNDWDNYDKIEWGEKDNLTIIGNIKRLLKAENTWEPEDV